MSNTDLREARHQATDATGLDNPTLAMNLSVASDYSSGMQFINLMDMSRSWIGHKPGQWGGMTYDQLATGGYVDENGWITEIPSNLKNVGLIWDWNAAYGASERDGTYVLTYEGEGSIGVWGEIISSEPGKIVFKLKEGQDPALFISTTDPNRTGDYIRNIAIVAEENLELHEAGAVFNPTWLELIKDVRQLRFMDWGDTNNSTLTSWDDRTTPESARNGNEVPVEYMVQLANEIGADPWFNMPHLADENYIRQYATYVRDNIDPDLTVRVEYSNEAWNFAFQQAQWMLSQSRAEWGNDAFYSYYAKMAVQTALIWKEVFSETGQEDQLITVIATQTANPWISEQIMKATAWKDAEPENYVDPATVFDELAVTTYFGGAFVSRQDLRNQLIDVIQDPAMDANAWLAEKLMDPATPDSVLGNISGLLKHKAIAEQYDLDIVSYEGGQHIHHSFAVNGLTAEDLNLLAQFLTDFVRSEEMAELYAELWKAWAEISDGPFMQFGDVSVPNKFGSWGIYSSVGDTTPRAEILNALNAENDPWWEGAAGGIQYQQGVILQARDMENGDDGVLLVGTAKVDYLIGGEGDDVFVTGTGDDRINGGKGSDRIVLSGSAGDYTLAVESNGYRLTGPDGSKFVVHVETFTFNGNATFSLEEMLAGSNLDVTETPSTPEPTPEDVPTPEEIPETSQPGDGATAGPIKHATAAAGQLASGTDQTAIEIVEDSFSPSGVLIGGINIWSRIGRELGLSGNDTTASYTVHSKNGETDFDGLTVGGSYWSMQENRVENGGALLSGSALETALEIGAIITHAAAIIATSGDDSFHGRELADAVYGGGGNDFLYGNVGNDTLYGDGGNDFLYGGSGDDLIVGGAGNDQLYGGAGDDLFKFDLGSGRDTVHDFSAGDSLELGGFLGELSLDDAWGNEANGDLFLSNGIDRITFRGLQDLSDLGFFTLA